MTRYGWYLVGQTGYGSKVSLHVGETVGGGQGAIQVVAGGGGGQGGGGLSKGEVWVNA